MERFRHITHWENTRRLRRLEAFYCYMNEYFATSRSHRRDNAKREKARQEINYRVDEVNRMVRAAEVDPSITWSPAPSVGGHARHVDVLLNLFNLARFQIELAIPYSIVERAIGVYRQNKKPAAIRTYNPIWWLYQSLAWFSRIPFNLIGLAGFDTARAEVSLTGRLVKVVFILIPFTAALLSIFDHLEWLDRVKAALP